MSGTYCVCLVLVLFVFSDAKEGISSGALQKQSHTSNSSKCLTPAGGCLLRMKMHWEGESVECTCVSALYLSWYVSEHSELGISVPVSQVHMPGQSA